MNRKGFTLTELLAVIVVLALIALIATPLVLSIIRDSARSSFSSSVNGLKKAIEVDYSDDEFATNIYYTYGGYNGNPNAATASSTRKLYRTASRDSYVTTGTEIHMNGSIAGYGVGHINEDGIIYVAAFTDDFCGYIDDTGDLKTEKISASFTKKNCIEKVTLLADW